MIRIDRALRTLVFERSEGIPLFVEDVLELWTHSRPRRSSKSRKQGCGLSRVC